MRRHSLLTMALVLLSVTTVGTTASPSVSSATAVAADERKQAVVEELFNGQNLEGWDYDPAHWRVEDRAIVGQIPPGKTLDHNTWIIWKGPELVDFDLRLEVRLTGDPGANSGIQFRCQAQDVNHVSGYQADLDQGATWLGRIYDEHGRALLVERGSRVQIFDDGKMAVETFAPAHQYGVLFRDNDWNDYRIVAIGDRVSIFINGTLFSELRDLQSSERDLRGQLAFQLHSGPETLAQFRNVRLERLPAGDQRLGQSFELKQETAAASNPTNSGVVPVGLKGTPLNLGFEAGDLRDWTAEGNAFDEQPVRVDGISRRWPDQRSNKNGQYFIGGYEHVQDAGRGTLTSVPFRVTHPWASLLFGGGRDASTRAEIVLVDEANSSEQVLFTANGNNREQMQRIGFNLKDHQGKLIKVRLVDENRGGWGHLNFDDFRFHTEAPEGVAESGAWRSTRNPVLQHLVPNAIKPDPKKRGTETTSQMHVPAGFSVDLIAAEPDLHQPMAFTFDARGRLWVVEGYCYPQKRPAGEGLDRILIFSDKDHDGSFEDRILFAEGLNLVSGLEVGFGGVWVGAAPELLFIPDANQDDVPDGPPQILLDGFGFADTHETLNSFQWGPDGWLYGNQGVFNTSAIGKPGAGPDDRVALSAGVWRYHPTRHQFEVFAHGGSNQWGLDYDEMGQWFMTHCRSYWGRGGTTHVMSGGHYWNQVNSGHAAFISSEQVPGLSGFPNYLLASARYDHGAGGAGEQGTDEVFGGHSHVGTLIYLGDNWPVEYRNHLLTHNLHGHQINHQINLREQGGYRTVHAGQDVLFCADRQFIGVDLQYGPDGAVYFSDWYDPRHCHNPDVEQWDRGNGRLYRMKFDSRWKPVTVNLDDATDEELVEYQLHPNDWFVRTAARLLQERSSGRSLTPAAIQQLEAMAMTHKEESRRLRAFWVLHRIGALSSDQSPSTSLQHALQDSSEYIRGWAVQLAPDHVSAESLSSTLFSAAERDNSLFVLRSLALVAQKLPADAAWSLVERLAMRSEITADRDLPSLLWFAVARLVTDSPDRALELAKMTPLESLRNQIQWYSAKTSATGRNSLVAQLARADGDQRINLTLLLELAVRGTRSGSIPADWTNVSEGLYGSDNVRVRRAAESIGVAFGDQALFNRMRERLTNASSSSDEKKLAISILSGDASPENMTVFLSLLDSKELTPIIIPLLRRYDRPEVGQQLVVRLASWSDAETGAAMEVLSSRASWALMLLDGIESKMVPKELLTAYYARQMAALGNSELTERLQRDWGTLRQTPEAVREEIAALSAAYRAAPLWAYEAGRGEQHFKKLCANCHLPGPENAAIAPRLAGSGARGIDYIVENVLNPNAVIGRDYQARVIVTKEGQVLNGLVEKDSESAIMLRTLTSSVTVPKADIEENELSTNSFMPEGLLKTLNDREKIELFKYLMSL